MIFIYETIFYCLTVVNKMNGGYISLLINSKVAIKINSYQQLTANGHLYQLM